MIASGDESDVVPVSSFGRHAIDEGVCKSDDEPTIPLTSCIIGLSGEVEDGGGDDDEQLLELDSPSERE